MDWYLEDLARLEGQPKRTIGDYVEQNRILVPRRFSSLAKARASGLPIIARSEHPQDYAGASGILCSPELGELDYQDVRNEEDLKQRAFKKLEEGLDKPKQFCNLLGYSEERFKQEVSFSFWELLDGYNRTVIADSAIPKRYHLMTFRYIKDKDKYFLNYSIVDGITIVNSFLSPLPEDLKDGLSALLDLYENIRSLGRFDRNHCPLMEFQTVGAKNFFLQYHRGRDFEPVEFRLERNLEDGEIEVPYLRGATKKGGVSFKITSWYAPSQDGVFNTEDEDGSWDISLMPVSPIFSELMVRHRKVQMIDFQSMDHEMLQLLIGHLRISKVFKPQISIICRRDDLLSEQEKSSSFYRGNKNHYMQLGIISDGRKCYVKRVQ